MFLISLKVENEIREQNDNDSITQRVRYEVDEGMNDDCVGRLLLTPRTLDILVIVRVLFSKEFSPLKRRCRNE